MKKTLIALAAVAATASFAQSSVQIVGTFDPSVANQKTTYGNGNSVTQNKVLNNAQGTSQITFKGTEDLGGGLKASFLLENDFDTAYDAKGPEGTSKTKGVTNFGSSGGEQFLALEGSFGKVAVGSPNTPSLTAQSAANPFGTKIGSGFGALNTGRVRSNNTLVYSTPVFSGFSAAVAYGFQAKADTGANQNKINTGANTDIGLKYANGPLAAGVSFWSTAATTGTVVASKNSEVNAYATYDLGVAKIGAGFYTEKQDATGASAVDGITIAKIDSKAYNLSAAVPLNANVSLLANYAKKDDKVQATNLDRTIFAVGVKYTLSKNTSVYARYVDDKIDNVPAASAATVKKTTTALVGMQTNF